MNVESHGNPYPRGRGEGREIRTTLPRVATLSSKEENFETWWSCLMPHLANIETIGLKKVTGKHC